MRPYLWALLLLASCKPSEPPPPKKAPPSVVAKEGDLLTITLLPEAEARLGIRTAAVESKSMPQRRTFGGEITVPPGRLIQIAAPLAGSVGPELPPPGARVTAGQKLVTLSPYLTAESRAAFAVQRIEAEGAIEGAKVQLAVAENALVRAEQLLRDKAGSQRSVDEARATRDVARTAMKTAETRRDLQSNAVGGTLEGIPLISPLDGVVRRVAVAPGQQVPAGTLLLEVADLTRLWVRIPLHAGELPKIDAGKEIRIEGLSAKPAAAPPSADPLGATVDLYYELLDPQSTLRPGQKVAATLPLRETGESLVVPWSAIVRDIDGGTWVYERTKERVYVRRRVELSHVDGDGAALTRGPAAGREVVSAGVAELFGTEFGHAK